MCNGLGSLERHGGLFDVNAALSASSSLARSEALREWARKREDSNQSQSVILEDGTRIQRPRARAATDDEKAQKKDDD